MYLILTFGPAVSLGLAMQFMFAIWENVIWPAISMTEAAA